MRPLLRRDAVVLRREGGAYLETADATAWFRGDSAYRMLDRLAPYLTGAHSVDRICRNLSARHEGVVREVITALLDRGIVVDASAGERPDLLDRGVARRFHRQLRYLTHLTDRPEERFHRFRSARILVTGGGAGLSAAVLVLIRNGAGDLTIRPDDGRPVAEAWLAEAARSGCRLGPADPPDAAGHDLVLRCVDRGGPAAVTRVVRTTPVGGLPVLASAVVAGWAVLGPVFRPGAAGCTGCVAVQLGIDPADTTSGPPPTPVVARMIGGSLGYTAFRVLTGLDPAPTAAVQELRTLRTLRLPTGTGCRACVGSDPPGVPVPPVAPVPSRTMTVPDQPSSTMRDFADAVLGRAVTPMPPAAFQPDWADRPLAHSTYPDAAMTPLPYPVAPLERPFPAGPPGGDAHCTVDLLCWLLHTAYGPLGRKLRFDSNHRAHLDSDHATASWSRGTASGGGLYPLELYWVAGAGCSFGAGLHHYAPSHHAFEHLDPAVTGEHVRRAVPHPDAASAAHFLVITARFWRTTFKYANYGYHVTSLDLGALLGSLLQLAAGVGLSLRPLLWFDDDELNRVLGLDHRDESVLAVVPLPWRPQQPSSGVSRRLTGPTRPAADRPAPLETSRIVRHFAWTRHVHRQTMLTAPAAPDLTAPAPTARHDPAAPLVPLPPVTPRRRHHPTSSLMRRRRSSSGGLAAVPPLALADLALVLAAAGAPGLRRHDVLPDDSPRGWTGLWVLAQHVEGLRPGGYLVDGSRHALRLHHAPARAGTWSDTLTRIGSRLWNYSLDQVAATIVVTGRLDEALDRYGPRGYRIVTAEAGAVTQTCYLASASAGIGCGAVLNLDLTAIAEVLGLPRYGERPLICLMVGSENSVDADFDQRID